MRGGKINNDNANQNNTDALMDHDADKEDTIAERECITDTQNTVLVIEELSTHKELLVGALENAEEPDICHHTDGEICSTSVDNNRNGDDKTSETCAYEDIALTEKNCEEGVLKSMTDPGQLSENKEGTEIKCPNNTDVKIPNLTDCVTENAFNITEIIDINGKKCKDYNKMSEDDVVGTAILRRTDLVDKTYGVASTMSKNTADEMKTQSLTAESFSKAINNIGQSKSNDQKEVTDSNKKSLEESTVKSVRESDNVTEIFSDNMSNNNQSVVTASAATMEHNSNTVEVRSLAITLPSNDGKETTVSSPKPIMSLLKNSQKTVDTKVQENNEVRDHRELSGLSDLKCDSKSSLMMETEDSKAKTDDLTSTQKKSSEGTIQPAKSEIDEEVTNVLNTGTSNKEDSTNETIVILDNEDIGRRAQTNHPVKEASSSTALSSMPFTHKCHYVGNAQTVSVNAPKGPQLTKAVPRSNLHRRSEKFLVKNVSKISKVYKATNLAYKIKPILKNGSMMNCPLVYLGEPAFIDFEDFIDPLGTGKLDGDEACDPNAGSYDISKLKSVFIPENPLNFTTSKLPSVHFPESSTASSKVAYSHNKAHGLVVTKSNSMVLLNRTDTPVHHNSNAPFRIVARQVPRSVISEASKLNASGKDTLLVTPRPRINPTLGSKSSSSTFSVSLNSPNCQPNVTSHTTQSTLATPATMNVEPSKPVTGATCRSKTKPITYSIRYPVSNQATPIVTSLASTIGTAAYKDRHPLPVKTVPRLDGSQLLVLDPTDYTGTTTCRKLTTYVKTSTSENVKMPVAFATADNVKRKNPVVTPFSKAGKTAIGTNSNKDGSALLASKPTPKSTAPILDPAKVTLVNLSKDNKGPDTNKATVAKCLYSEPKAGQDEIKSFPKKVLNESTAVTNADWSKVLRAGVEVTFEDGVKHFVSNIRDLMHLDDEPVTKWSEIKKGMEVVAKWKDDQFYDATVIGCYFPVTKQMQPIVKLQPLPDAVKAADKTKPGRPPKKDATGGTKLDRPVSGRRIGCTKCRKIFQAVPAFRDHQKTSCKSAGVIVPESAANVTDEMVAAVTQNKKQPTPKKGKSATETKQPQSSSRSTAPAKSPVSAEAQTTSQRSRKRKNQVQSKSARSPRPSTKQAIISGARDSSSYSSDSSSSSEPPTKAAKRCGVRTSVRSSSSSPSSPPPKEPLVKKKVKNKTMERGNPQNDNIGAIFKKGTKFLHRWQLDDGGSRWYQGEIVKIVSDSGSFLDREFEVAYKGEEENYILKLYEDFPADIRLIGKM